MDYIYIDHDHEAFDEELRNYQDEALKTPLFEEYDKQNSTPSFTNLVFQFPIDSYHINSNDQKSSVKRKRSCSVSSRKMTKDKKTFLTLPDSVSKFANAINSLPSPICPVSTPLPLTNIGNVLLYRLK